MSQYQNDRDFLVHTAAIAVKIRLWIWAICIVVGAIAGTTMLVVAIHQDRELTKNAAGFIYQYPSGRCQQVGGTMYYVGTHKVCP